MILKVHYSKKSLPQKIDELIALIQVENFDIIVLNETWLDTGI